MADKVMLFVDYQNSYHAARDVFHHPSAPHWDGQFHPGRLGRLLVERSPYDRTLAGVRIYRGLPSSSKDPKGYAACRAQVATWDRDPDVTPITRPLRYPADYPQRKAEEKGIDVALAVDLVMGAVKDWYDVAIVMSRDTDLKPAMEAVLDELHGFRVEVAAWTMQNARAGRLSLPGRRLWCHWLDEDDYAHVRDDHDYNKGAP
ncbi:MAG TPA: NYN domain-containing protein [Planctomycetes bacterium]|nr:NYN domain-containing protein [Planctomycetota bacterium]